MQKNIQNNLITWYNKNHRHFPWRETKNPYYIWISEIMLQQTTTEAVTPYYTRFIETFDTIDKLAKASLEDVYKLWEGLGYYRRAKHIHETAQFICENFHGQFPTTYKDILNLKGIGPYTAGAICSIAYGMSTPAIDGNVLRIISRLYALKDNIALAKTQKKIAQIVSELLIGYDASAFNQGLMDLGATICRPLNPQCQNCPIVSFCKAKEIGQQKVLPISIKNIKHKELNYITGIITYQDQYLMIQNPAGLLENLYGFIQYELESPYRFMEEFEKQYHLPLSLVSYHGQVKHVFTHRTWHMHIYHFSISHLCNMKLYHLEDISLLPVSTAHLKVLKHYLKQK